MHQDLAEVTLRVGRLRGGFRLSFAFLFALLPSAAFGEPVVFTYRPAEGSVVETVSVRGAFNDWGETPMVQTAGGSWSVTVDLPQGEHPYKYFVNGQWPQNMETDLDGGPLDADADAFIDDGFGGKNAVRRVGGGAPRKATTAPAVARPEGHARIHYHRPDGAYEGWGLHAWEDADVQVTWGSPLAPTGEDPFGLFWDVRLRAGARRVGLILHKGDQKDPGADQFLVIAEHGSEVWIVSGKSALSTSPPEVETLAFGDLSLQKAYWLDARTLVWRVRRGQDLLYRLHAAPEGGLEVTAPGVSGGTAIPLLLDSAGLSDAAKERFPQLAGLSVLRLSPENADRVPAFLKGQVVVSVSGPDGRLEDATGIQIPGVLDDLFAYEGPLGVVWEAGSPRFALWAPTATSVKLLLFETSTSEAYAAIDMTEESGLWSVRGDSVWRDAFYLYEVTVYVPATDRLERNLVTDPYSRSLSANSSRSQIVDLDDPNHKPEGWDMLAKPPLLAPEDIVLYELHVRDFSASDPLVPPPYRGTFLAFSVDGYGARHLRALAGAGLTHVHLMPAFDIATVNEERVRWQGPGDLSGFPRDSEEQQARVVLVQDADGYNWGYDPWHFGVPEGSYSTEPDGSRRVYEFRQMVQSLNAMGLRVVMDVVYNHTHASGQDPRAVLDRIVPGYYHRLNAEGSVETSTCCRNTATEHAMMEKLMIDDLLHWAVDYKVDGFRFDLMGHHMKRNLVQARDALQALSPAAHGVDGSAIYLYGEGWDFGEVQGGKRGVNATQTHMAGTGIGTFNDRLRDAARGGSPFTDRREQGFATGLVDFPNAVAKGDDLAALLDRIRAGLAGNLRSYALPGGRLAGASGGYTEDPEETVNYVSAHDNETLFDKIQFAAPAGATLAECAAMQSLAHALVLLAQGVPFFDAGSDLLRSKSLDADSYNSGDWFNSLDMTYTTNHFGMGLPPAGKNRDRWDLMRPLLSRADRTAGEETILETAGRFQDLLRIRKSSPLFRLRTAEDVMARVRFHDEEAPRGLIVMGLHDEGDGLLNLDPSWKRILVIWNGSRKEARFGDARWSRFAFALHPVQEARGEPRATFDRQSGVFTVPPFGAAVFVEAE